MNNRYFQLWLRWSILLVIIHAVVLGFSYNWHPPVVEKALLFPATDTESAQWIDFRDKCQISRWFDLLAIPLFGAMALPIYADKKRSGGGEYFLTALFLGLVVGIVGGVGHQMAMLTALFITSIALGAFCGTNKTILDLPLGILGLLIGLIPMFVLGHGLWAGITIGLGVCGVFTALLLLSTFCLVKTLKAMLTPTFWISIWKFMMVKNSS